MSSDNLSEASDNLSETIRPFVCTLVGMDFLLYLCTQKASEVAHARQIEQALLHSLNRNIAPGNSNAN